MTMKVLLISLFHPELIRGGAQQVCYELFRGLQQRPDVEATLLASVDSSIPALYRAAHGSQDLSASKRIHFSQPQLRLSVAQSFRSSTDRSLCRISRAH